MPEKDSSLSSYADLHRQSIEDREAFWGQHAGLVDWVKAPSQVLDQSRTPVFRWFPDGLINTCYNALDRHVHAGHGERLALIYDSPMADRKERITYAELLDRTSRCAGALRALGVQAGDRVLIYMPMVPEAVVTMLACARLGAVHSVVFGGFAPAELAARIDDATPRVVVSASCGIEPSRLVEYKPMLDEALRLSSHAPVHCIVLQRPQLVAKLMPGRDVDWEEILDKHGSAVDCVPVAATDPLYILYTSGTTGRPKGVVRDNGGHAVAMAWSMQNIYDIQPGQVWWAASDVGWVVGHSYIVYGPLIAGATTLLYEGKPVGTPHAGAFWRVIAEHRVEGFFTAPTSIRAIKKVDPEGSLRADHDLSRLRNIFLAGERLDPDTFQWATALTGLSIIDNWWQTETGWPIVANLRGAAPVPVRPGSPSVPVPGFDVAVLSQDGTELPAGTEGEICIRLPLPPGALTTLWDNEQGMVQGYLSRHPGFYSSGDGGYIDEDGYVYVTGRTDDVINVAGHRLTTGSMEAVVAEHPAVAECAVIGVRDATKGQVPRALVVLKAGVHPDPAELESELIAAVRERIGAVASFKDVVTLEALPKTRSGKILRRTMREIADGKDPAVPPTIEDVAVLDRVRLLLAEQPEPAR